MEVPVGKMVAPELLRGQHSFSLIRDLGETFAQRGCLMSQSQDSCGSFRVAVKEALEEIMAGVSRRNESQGSETLVVVPEDVVAPPCKRRTNWEE